MDYKDYFYFGRLTKTFGSIGQIFLFPEVDDPGKYLKLDKIFVELEHQLIPFFINELKVHGNQIVVTLNNVKTIDQAQLLGGRKVYLPVSFLPELTGTRFYYHEIPGYTVSDESFGIVGKVLKVIDLPQNPLFEIDCQGKNVLIPIADEIILDIDRNKRMIYVRAPEGLIELYLE